MCHPYVSLCSVSQIEDRRSSVNKQACYTLSTLSALLGPRFQDHAAYFLPTLFKVLPITVQVGTRRLTVPLLPPLNCM